MASNQAGHPLERIWSNEVKKISLSYPCKSAEELVKHCMHEASLDGMFLDFNVHTGRTINAITRNSYGRSYPFDSVRLNPGEWSVRKGRKVGFLHVDCGLYSEARRIFNALELLIVPGTILVSMEYFNKVAANRSEFLAWHEFTSEHELEYSYIGYVPRKGHVGIKVLSRRQNVIWLHRRPPFRRCDLS